MHHMNHKEKDARIVELLAAEERYIERIHELETALLAIHHSLLDTIKRVNLTTE